MSQINIKHVANLDNESLRGLEFYEQELVILQKRLDQIAADNTGKEVAEKIEHFQNQFLIHKDAIERLRHRVRANTQDIELQVVKTDPFVDLDSANEHESLVEQYLTEEKMFNEMRQEFNRFAAEWL
ncbi:MAG TPA: hypothetical protein VFE54_06865 [Mucilaginibacter sp.]|jgi:hypothetical protein|nr:hypothetical protein [Mucilaginibacter sp.]